MTLFPGRAALQKRIMALLRKIEHCVNGVQPVSNDLIIINITHSKKKSVTLITMLGGSLVTTEWRGLRLQVKGRPPAMEGRCE
jgi:hypothetical protein